MRTETRRSFHGKMLGSLMAYGLIEMLSEQDLLAEEIKPTVDKWFADLNELSGDLKQRKVKDLVFQEKLEELFKKVDLPELLRFVKLDRIAKQTRIPEVGAKSVGFDLSRVEGLPKRVLFGRQIFCLREGSSIVPHGHDNMCTGFIVLSGDFRGRHYDRVEDHKDHFLIKPTIDRTFKPGECSTVSDRKDNVHWFKSLTETGFVFNIHVLGYNPEKDRTGRVYLDPEGEKTKEGLIVAKRMSSAECHRKYG